MSTFRVSSLSDEYQKQLVRTVEAELARRNALRVVQEHYTGKLGVQPGTHFRYALHLLLMHVFACLIAVLAAVSAVAPCNAVCCFPSV